MCNRRIDIHGLSGFFLLLLRLHILKRPHVMKAVSQLDKNYADIFCHGKKHLSKILRLNIHFILRIRKLSQFGDSVHQKGNFLIKHLRNIFQGKYRIFHNIMKQPCYDCLFIQLQFRKNNRHTHRVDNVWFSGLSPLFLMCIISELIGFFNHRKICGRVIYTNGLY